MKICLVVLMMGWGLNDNPRYINDLGHEFPVIYYKCDPGECTFWTGGSTALEASGLSGWYGNTYHTDPLPYRYPVQQIPEPATVVLLTCGLVAVRKRKFLSQPKEKKFLSGS